MSGFGQTFSYGAPSMLLPGDRHPRLEPQPFVPHTPIAPGTRKVTVTCRVDDDGKLWLRISAEGRVISEVSGDGRNLSLTEDL